MPSDRAASRFILVLMVSLMAMVFCLVQTSSAEDDTPRLMATEVAYPVRAAVSAPLREIEPMVLPPGEGRDKEVFNTMHPKAAKAARSQQPNDPVWQLSPGPFSMPSPLSSFPGMNNLDNQSILGFKVAPPDTNGDIGPNHYVQWVNLIFEVFDRSGNSLYGPVPGNTLFTALGAPCATANSGDPIVLYDSMADRWLASQFALPNFPSGPFYQCIALSTTGDPTGSWYLWEYEYSQTVFNDYPKWGVWPDSYSMSANQYMGSDGVGVVAFERDAMLTGGYPARVYFDVHTIDPGAWGMLPADLDGPNQPPAGTPGLFVEFEADELYDPGDALELWELDFNPALPWMSTMTQLVKLPTASFDPVLCTAYRWACIDQPDTTKKLETLSDRLMHRAAYRNFGTHQSLYLNHTVDADGAGTGGIRWYELRNQGSGWSIYQQGTFAPDGDHRWMGSIAADGDGNIAIGYSVSSSTTYPSIRYAGRYANDPLGQLTQGEAEVIAGTGSQYGVTRWGDYSMMSIDPTDDATFWYTQEHVPVTSSRDWHTEIASFRMPPESLTVELPFSAPQPLRNHADGSFASIVNPPVYWLRFCDVAGVGAYEFVGNTARIEVFDNLDEPDEITLETWVRVDGPIPSGITRYASMVRKVGSYSLFIQPWGGHHFVFWVDAVNGGARQVSSSDVIPFDGSWYHVVGTYNGNTGSQRIFVNGQRKDISGQLSGPVVGTAGTAYIGEGIPAALDGVLGNVNIYNRALTDAEVLALYQSYTIDPSHCFRITKQP